ncbi:penicillin-binding protein activator [Gluconobacter wancherniae]
MVSRTSASSVAFVGTYSGSMARLRKGARISVAAGALATLAACAGGNTPPGPGVNGVPGSINSANASHDVGLILPLTGRNAVIGARMRDAAVLALSSHGSPKLDIHDSNGPGGSLQAVNDAVAHGDAILLGPLTATDTAMVSPVALNAGLPELAFTSDSGNARPGVWVLGLTPEQQVRRMIDAARATGRKTFAAFLPDNALGHATGDGLVRACQDAGLAVPQVVYHSADPQSIVSGLKTLSAIDTRMPATAPVVAPPVADGPSAIDPVAEAPPAAPVSAAPAAPAPAVAVPPPPFDGLVLADTGLALAQVIAELKADHIDASNVQIMGPALWKAFDGKLGALHGAWYAAPDARDRNGYVAQYRAVYHQPPSPVTDLSYDAAALSGALIKQGGVTAQGLTRADGFMGVDGLFRLLPDGHVTRALAIFQIQPGGGARIVVPASREIAVRPS